MTGRIAVLYFVALLLTALLLGPALAHLLELPAKLALGREDYFVVQRIYAGWSLLAVPLLLALLADSALLFALHRAGRRWRLVGGALLCLVGGQVLFWLFTWPANQATANWTQQPADWARLRAAWEWSHAGNAGLTLLSLVLLLLSLLRQPPATAPDRRQR